MSIVKAKIRKALRDSQLKKAVLHATDHSLKVCDNILAELPDYEAARDAAREVRQRSLDNLDNLLAKFEKKFTEAGGVVHHAADPAEANKIIIKILKEHKATRGVKSKSMVSEEIHLGDALTKAGIDAIESDLGEYIVQLAGEPPSHITAPALHRSRQSIGKLFAEKLGVPYIEDPSELTQIAREKLRERFIHAQFGISGANFFVAETGHLAIVENEGNVRMGLSTPPLFIAVTGVEKVVENFTYLAPLMKLLARSATGQRFPGYLNLLRPGRPSEDGATESHVVLIDNGRRRTLADSTMREMLLCIRCGACLNVCPVYRSIGGHAYDSVYPGPMGAVLSNLLGEKEMMHAELSHLSTLCGACLEVCPVRIDLPHLLIKLRQRGDKPLPQKIFAIGWQATMTTSARFNLAGRLANASARMIPGGIPGGWMKTPAISFRDRMLGRPDKARDIDNREEK